MENKMNHMAPLFEERHSGRSFDSEHPVTLEQLHILVETARFAPSCFNDQPWNFIVCDKATDPDAYQKLLSCLVEKNQEWAKEAPVLILAVAGSKFHKNGKPNRWGPYDTGAASMSLVLQATVMGLMTHQMGGFDENKASQEFQIPEEFHPYSVIAVGYEKAGQEKMPKDRRPLHENFFLGAWGKPFKKA